MGAPMSMDPSCVGKRPLLGKTCITCGRFTDEYRKNGLGYWQQDCNPCHVKVSHEIDRKSNEESRAKADQHYQPWTDHQIETLFEMSEQGYSGMEIAEKVGRTLVAVRVMKSKLKDVCCPVKFPHTHEGNLLVAQEV